MPFDPNPPYWIINVESGKALEAPRPGGPYPEWAAATDWAVSNESQVWHFEEAGPGGYRMRAGSSPDWLGLHEDGFFSVEPLPERSREFGIVMAEAGTIRISSATGHGVVSGGEPVVECLPEGGQVGQHWLLVEADPNTVSLPPVPAIDAPSAQRLHWLRTASERDRPGEPGHPLLIGDMLDSIQVRLHHDLAHGLVATETADRIWMFLNDWLLIYGGEDLHNEQGVTFSSYDIQVKIQDAHDKITPDPGIAWDDVKSDLDDTGLEPSVK